MTGGWWQVERYDVTWGGWRAVPASFEDDSPARYDDEQEAREAAAEWASRRLLPGREVRVREV